MELKQKHVRTIDNPDRAYKKESASALTWLVHMSHYYGKELTTWIWRAVLLIYGLTCDRLHISIVFFTRVTILDWSVVIIKHANTNRVTTISTISRVLWLGWQ